MKHTFNKLLDIIFITLLALIVALLNMNLDFKLTISEQENRNLTQFKPLFIQNHIVNQNFTKDFESWFIDRIAFRQQLISIYQSIKYYTTSRYFVSDKAYLDKKTKWAYELPTIHLPISEDNINNDIVKLKYLNSILKTNNIKFYIIVVPEKNDIYLQSTFYKKQYLQNYKEITRKIAQETNIPVIYPYDELKKGSQKSYVYFKTDHHWTHFGAYIGYYELLKTIKKDFPNIKPLELSEFDIKKSNLIWISNDKTFGATIDILNLNKKIYQKYRDTDYNFYEFNEQNKKQNLKVLLCGTSQGFALSNFLDATFIYAKFIYNDWGRFSVMQIIKNNLDEILSSKPDVFIYCMTVDDIKRINGYKNDDN